MSANVGRYTPVAGAVQPVDTGLPWEYIRIINSSPYMLSLSLGGQGTIDFPEMYLEDIKIEPSYNGKLSFTPVANIANPAAALTNYVSINVYQRGEIKQPQAQPLTTMANVGNSVPLNATATSVAHDTNTVDEFIEASLSGVKTRSDTSDGLISLLKKLNGANQSYIAITPADGAGWNIDELTGTNSLAFVQGGVQQEVHPTKGTKYRTIGQYLGGLSLFTGTTTGTYNHNLANTPNLVEVCQNAVGSQTMGADTYGATTVHVTSAAGNAFVGLAMDINA